MITSSERAILIVDDSLEDYEVMERALRDAGAMNPLFHCKDGRAALDFLNRRKQFADPAASPRPCLIILDLKMPDTSGLDVLVEIKTNDNLKRIPVLVVTVSDDEDDIEKCYTAGANCYVKKPVATEAFVRTLQRLSRFWFQVAVLPAPI